MAEKKRSKDSLQTNKQAKAPPDEPGLKAGVVFKVVPLSSLHLDPANARQHSQRNKDVVKASLIEFGPVQTLCVDKTGKILGGNCTFACMKELGITQVRVCEVDLSDVKAAALAIALNRSAELADWDNKALLKTLKAIQAADDCDMELTGFDELDLERIEDDAVKQAAQGASDNADVGASVTINHQCLIIVTCKDEEQQRVLLERLTQEGLPCKALLS